MIKVLIIGADGFIGKSMYEYFLRNSNKDLYIKGTYFNSSIVNCDFLDVTIKNNLNTYVVENKPDFIIHLAGTKDVKLCEDNFEFAYKLNTQPVFDLINIIETSKISSKLLYFSSDYVFDGEKGNYKSNEPTNPRTNYGKSKALAEKALLNSNINFKIIRTSAVLGKGANFFDWLINGIKYEKSINLFDNTYFSPTPQIFLNKMILYTILNYDNIPNKILHIVGEKRLTRYDLAVYIKENIINSNIEIIPIKVDLLNSTFQKDLSLQQSNFIKKIQKKDFYSYIKEEINC